MSLFYLNINNFKIKNNYNNCYFIFFKFRITILVYLYSNHLLPNLAQYTNIKIY